MLTRQIHEAAGQGPGDNCPSRTLAPLGRLARGTESPIPGFWGFRPGGRHTTEGYISL